MDEARLTTPRRGLIAVAAAGAALSLAACAKGAGDEAVSAAERLMRNQGVLRRILVVYREAAGLIRANFSAVDGRQVWQAADLFRRFGEVYHQQQVEEAHVFPQALKAGGAAAALVPTLLAQQARGRQITAYVQAKTAAGAIAGADAVPLAEALETFARMYEAQAAFEDTVVYPAWRVSLSAGQLADAGRQFADIEKAAGASFEAAVSQVAAIEAALRIGDLSRYTAPAPGVADQGVMPLPPDVKEGAD